MSGLARAEGHSVPVDLVPPGTIKINGILSDWPAGMTPLDRKLSGNPGSGADLTARAALAADDDALYVSADIIDDRLVRTASYAATEDHLTLVLGVPTEGGGFTTLELDLFQGDPGNVPGAVLQKGEKVPGSSLVEAPRPSKDGFTLEAKIPWTSLPAAARVRCGLRGGFRYTDNDGSGAKGVVGSMTDGPVAKMPWLANDGERAILEVFAKEKNLAGEPSFDRVADLTGDEQRERVMVWGSFVLVVGPHFKEGKQFYFSELGGTASSFDLKDSLGLGKAQIVMRRRQGTGAVWRESFEVWTLPGDSLTPLFQHEVAVSTESGSIVNTVRFEGKQIDVELGTVTGLTASGYNLAPETSFDGVLLPWGAIKSQSYRFDAGRFTKVKEETKAAEAPGPAGTRPAGTPAGPPDPPPPPAPRPPTADELQDQVLAVYRKDRKVDARARPRFDLATNVAEDTRNERILVFGKDLVVFGKGFLGGLSYVAVGLGFADPKDVADVTTRDLNGDGRAEIIVRGVQRMDAPKDLGKGQIEREVVLVYSVQGGKLARVFAAETGMSFDGKRVSSTMAFLPAAHGLELQLGPGHASGWEARTFPFRQESAPSNGIEPLLLPWTSAPVRFHWGPAGYTR
jgi:hypothetical protein